MASKARISQALLVSVGRIEVKEIGRAILVAHFFRSTDSDNATSVGLSFRIMANSYPLE